MDNIGGKQFEAPTSCYLTVSSKNCLDLFPHNSANDFTNKVDIIHANKNDLEIGLMSLLQAKEY